MKPNQVKRLVLNRITELQNELDTQLARTGKNVTQLLLDDPFLAGRMYSMNMLTLDLIKAMTVEDEDDAVDEDHKGEMERPVSLA